ncbi:MAG: hypothetical protein Q8903_00870 [Bacteroidota bacterium]|nr:hypothetical protein [Bacteroidota bacterium]
MLKIISGFISICFVSVLFYGCTPSRVLYHSQASVPFFHRSTKTVFHMVNYGKIPSIFKFAVIAAKDNDTLSYVVLAPIKHQLIDSTKLTDVDLNNSITLLPAQVEEFIKILNSSAEKWDTKFNTMDGISYSFVVSPEDKNRPQIENIPVWHPTLNFYFQNNYKGPLVSIIFGEDLVKYDYIIDESSELIDLSNMLSLAIKK